MKELVAICGMCASMALLAHLAYRYGKIRAASQIAELAIAKNKAGEIGDMVLIGILQTVNEYLEDEYPGIGGQHGNQKE